MTERQTFEEDGRAIPYLEDGEGPTLVLIPARELDFAYLDTLVHIIVDEGFHVVRIGANSPQDVIDVMDHLDLDHAWIGGHEVGGTIARAAALDHVDRVNGVLILSVEPEGAGVADGGGQAPLAPGVPVLIVHGTEDQSSPLVNAEQLQASAPDRATLVRIEGGGHHFPASHPGETGFAITEYLDWD